MNLVKVHTVYRETFWIDADRLTHPRPFLVCYNAAGKELYHGRGKKRERVILHRDNICPHPLNTFTELRYPDGCTEKFCLVCDKLAARMAATGELRP